MEFKIIISKMSMDVACAASSYSDLRVHPRSLNTVFAEDALAPWLPTECPAKSNQIAQMRR